MNASAKRDRRASRSHRLRIARNFPLPPLCTPATLAMAKRTAKRNLVPRVPRSLVSGLVARRDSFPQKSGVPVVVRMLSFIKTEVNVSREVRMLDGNQKS